MKIENIRARYGNGVLVPLEPLNLAEGKEVVMSISDASQSGNNPESMLDMFERLRKSVPHDAWDNLPSDLAKNKKHYLYGFPKEAD